MGCCGCGPRGTSVETLAWGVTQALNTNEQGLLCEFWPPSDMWARGLECDIVAVQTATQIEMGLYLVSSGGLLASASKSIAAGHNRVTIPATKLQRGEVYYFAALCDAIVDFSIHQASGSAVSRSLTASAPTSLPDPLTGDVGTSNRIWGRVTDWV